MIVITARLVVNRSREQLQHFYDFLDNQLFPRVIAYTTHHLHIIALMMLWFLLLIGGSFTAFELVGGNYTNGLSALASCIVLLQQMKHQNENKELHAQHREQIRDLHAKIDALK